MESDQFLPNEFYQVVSLARAVCVCVCGRGGFAGQHNHQMLSK